MSFATDYKYSLSLDKKKYVLRFEAPAALKDR